MGCTDTYCTGGIILLPLGRRNCGGLLARLTVEANDYAQGRLLPDFGGFMPLRHLDLGHLDRHDAADRAFRTIDDKGDQRPTTLPADIITDEANPFEFFAALILPGGGWNHLTFIPSNGDPTETWIAQGDGSWVCHTTGTDGAHTVHQGGPTPLWDRIETAHHHWRHIGQPARDRFGLTVHHGRHTIWLDHPDSPHQWELPPSHHHEQHSGVSGSRLGNLTGFSFTA